MPFIVPFIPLIAAVAGPLLASALGGGSKSGSSGSSSSSGTTAAATPAVAPAAAQPAASPLFTNPSDITNWANQYKTNALAKWNQINANMGAGGPANDTMTTAIGNQAEAMAGALGGLTTQSGYGDKPTNTTAILQGLEPGLSAQYPLY